MAGLSMDFANSPPPPASMVTNTRRKKYREVKVPIPVHVEEEHQEEEGGVQFASGRGGRSRRCNNTIATDVLFYFFATRAQE